MADADNNNINPPAPEGTINNQSPPMEPLPPVDNNPVMAAAMPPPIDVKFGDVIPNSKPREVEQVTESYVYRDFASADPGQLEPGIAHKNMPPSALQSQKLPSKLAAMLSDPDLAAVITWMPHGRSWKILNRDLFSQFALPRYFGHSNHASFVRIVNAWGFRRIASGVDRDSYYHELFLRGKPKLHERMKRVPNCHKKTPIGKDDKHPDFYELSKTSPLPEVAWTTSQGFKMPAHPPPAGQQPMPTYNPMGSYVPDPYRAPGAPPSDAPQGFPTVNGMVGGGMLHANPNFNNPMSLVTGQAPNAGASAPAPVPPPQQDLSEYTKALQKENENLLLKIKVLEYENQARQQNNESGEQPPPVADDGKQESEEGVNQESNATEGGGQDHVATV